MAVELADVDLADQRRDVLVVLVTRLGLGDRHLAQHRRVQAHHAELRDVAVELLQALDRPRRHDAREIAARNAVFLFERVAEAFRMEQAERRLVHRRALERVDGVDFHQHLQA
ncbi:hypothetical protein CNMCM8686_000052 [Aspergillus fumigatus]|nr:hypothetical protein CNMCM8686_000052 [Aspergillus fumigatus]